MMRLFLRWLTGAARHPKEDRLMMQNAPLSGVPSLPLPDPTIETAHSFIVSDIQAKNTYALRCIAALEAETALTELRITRQRRDAP